MSGASLQRHLFVTVGTSLLESASWDPQHPALLNLDGYAAWCQSETVTHLERRRSTPEAAYVKSSLQALLADPRTASDLVKAFVREFQTRGRYSAEIATLMAVRDLLYRAEQNTLSDFLRAVYPSIDFVCGRGAADPSRIAAQHLRDVLLDLGVGAPDIHTLSSDLSSNLKELFELLRPSKTPVDVVVSGGYKGQAIVAAHALQAHVAARENWRLFYMHEDSSLIGEWGTRTSEEPGISVHVERGGRFDPEPVSIWYGR